MAGPIELSPTLMTLSGVVSFLLTGSIAILCWCNGWHNCSCCRKGSREDRYKEEGDSDDEEPGTRLGKPADKFMSEWESNQRSFQSPRSPSGPPPASRAPDPRRGSVAADRIEALARSKLAQSGHRATLAAASRERRLSITAKHDEEIMWTGHGAHTQRKTMAELREIAKQEQAERMQHHYGFLNGGDLSPHKQRKPKEHKSELQKLEDQIAEHERRQAERRAAASDYAEVSPSRRRAASSGPPEAPAPSFRAPSRAASAAPSGRAASAAPSGYDAAPAGNDGNEVIDLTLLRPPGAEKRFASTNSDPPSGSSHLSLPSASSTKPRRRSSRKEGSSSQRRDMSDALLTPETLPRSRERPRSSEAPRRRRSSNEQKEDSQITSHRRVSRQRDLDMEAPVRSARRTEPGRRGRSTSPRPEDDYGMPPSATQTMPSRSRRTVGARSDNPDWPGGMMNF